MKIPLPIIILIILINLLFSFSSENTTELIPESFDSREKWKNCIPKIYDQGSCGACYAMSVSTAFSMRYCIRNELFEISEEYHRKLDYYNYTNSYCIPI